MEIKVLSENNIVANFYCPNCGNEIQARALFLGGGGSANCKFCGIGFAVTITKERWLEITVLTENQPEKK